MPSAQLSPRQKMINMMYLVLTAILAINVSSEVLDAFKSVNDGIDVSNKALNTKNTDMYSELGKEYARDSAKAKQAYEKSRRARQIATRLYAQLEHYKQRVIAGAGGIDSETGKIKRDDDLEVATRIFVEKEGREGKGLKLEIEKTRNELLMLLPAEDKAAIDRSLALKVDTPAAGKTWEYAHFNQVPAVAAVTLLTKYQNDLLNAENHVIETLYSSINKAMDKVDRMEAKIISPSSYILQGELYKADVMVAAYSSTQNPEVFLGQFNSNIKRGEDGSPVMYVSASAEPPLINPVKVDVSGGFGKLQMPGSGIGNRRYTGVVRIKGPADEYKFYPFEGEYQVAPKLAVVSPQKLNVLYIGLDNPVDISVPGIAQSDMVVQMEGGTLVKNEDGSYKALVTTPGNAKVKVSARIAGKIVPMGEKQFKTKRVPNPHIMVDGRFDGGRIKGTVIEQSMGIVARLDEFIYGEVPFRVISYTLAVRRGDQVFKEENTGGAYTSRAKQLLVGLKKGDAVFVDDVMVKGPDGVTRKVSPIAFDISVR